ncbi:NERD domain-containing protein/DEAD/DEAH box helicase [Modicisalibacter xianhensis]|uniref:Nuclease-related domain-containing protein n=1 Tax=Modicisalibacter xianhensis TaxID=442341 RepID=A0A1I2ZJZ9_9GAMM|nr:NERD domain-containing protein/DEAD/DEAH box helicase [Halomonas xianhensis]SFH38177.1 Nuclease-related domain-containing protein [Halomonas xianhensis]
MAEIIPSLESIDLQSLPDSERRVLEVLHALEFPGLQVYFSMPMVIERQRGDIRSEADFILFHPRHGLLVWEVKGGGVSYENGVWYSRNRQGKHQIKDPVKQADTIQGALLRKIRKELGESFSVPIGRNVVFPDVTLEQVTLPMGLERRYVIDFTALQSLTADSLMVHFRRWPHQERLPVSSMEQTWLMEKVLNPTFHLTVDINATIERVEKRLVQLTSQQLWALELLHHIPRMVIVGGAGTGKSILARQKALELAQAGKRVLMLCYTEALAAHLRHHVAEIHPEPLEGLEIRTFHSAARNLVTQAGGQWRVPETLQERARFYEQAVPDQMIEAAGVIEDRYDALIVDEAQDFEPIWWLALHDFLKQDALVALFADPAQNLFGREFEIPTDAFSDMVPYYFPLTWNCRNAREIIDWLMRRFEFANPPADTQPSSGYQVEEFAWTMAEEQEAQLKRAWATLKENGVMPEQLAILSPHAPEESQGIQAFKKAFPKGQFRYSSIRSFKGLQAPFVFLVDMDTSDFAAREDLWYVGATRATLGLKTFSGKT